MQLGMIGLGRMGANMVRRLMRGGHQCVVFDHEPGERQAARGRGGDGGGLARRLRRQAAKAPRGLGHGPRRRADRVDREELARRFEAGDTIIDGGNSYFKDDVRRARSLEGPRASIMSTWARAAASGASSAATA